MWGVEPSALCWVPVDQSTTLPLVPTALPCSLELPSSFTTSSLFAVIESWVSEFSLYLVLSAPALVFRPITVVLLPLPVPMRCLSPYTHIPLHCRTKAPPPRSWTRPLLTAAQSRLTALPANPALLGQSSPYCSPNRPAPRSGREVESACATLSGTDRSED